jgi:CheY-like chemotaxis protein
MVIEDDRDIRESLKGFLESEGYRVIAAENGQVALDHLKILSPLPSLILLDLMMPVMDGQTFHRIQASDPALCHIPIVVCSANPEALLKMKGAGIRHFLKKPPDLDRILEAVKKYTS